MLVVEVVVVVVVVVFYFYSTYRMDGHLDMDTRRTNCLGGTFSLSFCR